MSFLYSIAMSLYYFMAVIVSVFNNKAKRWLDGRKHLFKELKQLENVSTPKVWFHCASLGEFEQARPVIEQYKKLFPDKKIVLTFFSPSGYEVRKNYSFADYVFYMPLDTKRNARRFIDMVKPEKVFFVKYEFWYHYLTELKKRGIETISISSIFRSNQLFFKSYGKWYKNMLKCFSFFYVQNEQSKQLLNSIGINNVEVTGDTRFDRVSDIARQTKSFEEIDAFCNSKKVIVAGSTWRPDEELMIKFIKDTQHDVKLIIAPHEIHTSNIKRLKAELGDEGVLFSEINKQQAPNAKVLVIDNIGMLASLYKYGDIAYIGGGFGVGIHNILEAATFGLPVVFGPNYYKFQEARDLIDRGAAFSIKDYEVLQNILGSFFENKLDMKEKGKIAAEYIEEKRGATKKILGQ